MMNHLRNMALAAAAACTVGVSLAACSVATTASPAPGPAPVAGGTVIVSGLPGRFPLPQGAQVIEDSSDHGHDSIIFGSVTPSAVSSFYATALPRAGYTIISDSSAAGDSWDSFSGTGIWFTGHGYNGQIGALSSFQIPGFSLGGNTVEITLTPQ
jgi:hypothetical protein